MYFDPFDKALDAIVATDLPRLRDVTEGWYVEYKRAPISSRDVGKSLSALANHFGGWLIFGVDAPQRTPAGFPGLDRAQTDQVMNGLRDALRHHINPVVVFESREVAGPCDSIGLPVDRSVVIVRVPQGHNPPYIHSSGRIYRRLADASDPKPETDRAVVDHLVERSREYREAFRRRIESRPEFSKGERKMPVLQVLLTTDPWQERRVRHVLGHKEFADVMGREDDAPYAVALDSSFPNAFGFTARHIAGNDPFSLVYTWEFSHYGFSSVVVPLRILDQQVVPHYKYADDFFAVVPDSLRDRAIDVTALWLILTSILAKHDVLAAKIGLEGDTFVKFRFLNVWRNVPYLDSKDFIDVIRAHGVPVVQHSELTSPPETTPDDMWRVRPRTGSLGASFKPLVNAGGVLSLVLGPLGVSSATAFANESDGFFGILQRAAKAYGGAAGQTGRS